MAINTEMRVTGIAEYKNAMSQARQSVKTLDDELKKSEAQYKATGDKETYMADKTRILQKQLQEQQRAAKAAENALKQMTAQGVDPSSTAYQKMESELYKAQAQMFSTTSALDQLKRGELEAASGADQLTASVNGISKKMSVEQVISGIDSITGGLESAAKKAVSLGEVIWKNVTDKAAWADDVATAAKMLGMSVEDYQRYEGVFKTVGELTIQDWMNAKRKVESMIYSPSKEQTGILELLGIDTHETISGAKGDIQGAAKDWETIFWEVSEELKNRIANGTITEGMADQYFEAIFGKKYMNYKNFIDLGQEGFKEAFNNWDPVDEETVNQMAELNDKLIKLKEQFGALETEVLRGLAPALTAGADALSKMLSELMKYLQSEDGQKLLDNMGEAISGLFKDLSKIDPQKVVEGFAGVFTGIVDALKWLVDNKGTIITAMGVIVGGWAAMKLTGGALKVYQLINGITGMVGGVGTASMTGTLTGAAWGGAFAKAVLAAAPWLTGLYALLNPAETGSNDIVNQEGQLTEEGLSNFLQERENFKNLTPEQAAAGEWKGNRWAELIFEAGEIVQESSKLWDDIAGIQALARYASSGDREQLARELEGLGYVLQVAAETVPDDMPGTDVTNDKNKAVFKNRLTGEVEKVLEDGMDAPQVVIDPVPPQDANQQIAEEIGTVTVPVMFSVEEMGPEETAAFFGTADGSNANGIWSVPFDGYRAILHRGERVTPAREIASRNFSSNLYVESMIMSGNTDAEGLAAAMAAAQRRTMNGYGS